MTHISDTTNGSITVRPMAEADIDAVAKIYAANARDALSPDERAKQGFVQGRMSPERLRSFTTGGSGFVATDGEEVFAATVIHAPDAFTGKPSAQRPGESPAARTVELAQAARLDSPVLYGPSVVAENYRGRGVLRQLVEAVADEAQTKGYSHLLAFMEDENAPSFAAHERLGFLPLGGFRVEDRDYQAVMLPLA
ncbi:MULTISPECIES: GNAT family N-acetyltransferase [Trueperella]|uniref:L-amino acid N-acyltransferase YncA n=1 Tax=Trueperella abortisuis TaxID=445930 RepID=A0ABT9PL05_9ACTO|nr:MULTISPECIES: GNAT family N-acetyltransferase [Trueperella]MDP9833392.1 L-amino acid N-acyltransferase YncA [Trueperella abortisuis]MDY5403569.1 GNAT family N-acetyltransferase [Trueperella sp.]